MDVSILELYVIWGMNFEMGVLFFKVFLEIKDMNYECVYEYMGLKFG